MIQSLEKKDGHL